MAHFLLQNPASDGLLAYIFLICKKSRLTFSNILQNITNSFNGFIRNALSLTVYVDPCVYMCMHVPFLFFYIFA